MSCREARASAASFSSIFDMAKPTWMRTQSPITRPSSSSSPILMIRVTPDTSTRARCSFTLLTSFSWPGIPRHMAFSLLNLSYGDDLDPDVHLWFDLQHQHAGWLHPELTNVEVGLAIQLDRLVVDDADTHHILVVARHAAEDDVAIDPVAVAVSGWFDLAQNAINSGESPGVDPFLQFPVLHPVA